jgi:hypothetical protein
MEAALEEEARTALITAAAGSIHASRGERVALAAVHEEVQQAKELSSLEGGDAIPRHYTRSSG